MAARVPSAGIHLHLLWSNHYATFACLPAARDACSGSAIPGAVLAVARLGKLVHFSIRLGDHHFALRALVVQAPSVTLVGLGRPHRWASCLRSAKAGFCRRASSTLRFTPRGKTLDDYARTLARTF